LTRKKGESFHCYRDRIEGESTGQRKKNFFSAMGLEHRLLKVWGKKVRRFVDIKLLKKKKRTSNQGEVSLTSEDGKRIVH